MIEKIGLVYLNSFTLARVLESYIKGREHIGLNCPSNALVPSHRLEETIAQTNNLTLSSYYMLPAS